MLDCIAVHSNYLNIYSHIHVYWRKQIEIYQLQNVKSDFPKFCKVYVQQSQENKSDIFVSTFSRNLFF